uniref:SH3 domain-containing protein n=1 Tax=Electrophorus electricus TaxID=8005 RepID=A0A4W4F392_ELEEL
MKNISSANRVLPFLKFGILASVKICDALHTFTPSCCVYFIDVISVAKVLEDYIASDCRFINLKKGKMIYVYSKFKPVEGTGLFWLGSVYGDHYVDQMGIIGYFPSNHVNETHIFEKKTIEMPTADMDFFCA